MRSAFMLRGQKVFHLAAIVGVCSTAWLALAASVAAQNVARVEEDWEICLGVPSEDKTAPQFETLMSSHGDTSRHFFRVTWNYLELPDFSSGGLQLQACDGADVEAAHSESRSTFTAEHEHVTWTQVLTIQPGKATLKIVNGDSTTWGAFGGEDTKVEVACGLGHLNQYSPDLSKQKSGITYGSNRVHFFRLNQVRYFDAAGNLLNTDTTQRVVFQQDAE